MQASLSFRKDFPIPQLYIDRIRSIYKKCFPFSTKEKSTSVKRKIYIGILDKETKKKRGEKVVFGKFIFEDCQDNFCRSRGVLSRVVGRYGNVGTGSHRPPFLGRL